MTFKGYNMDFIYFNSLLNQCIVKLYFNIQSGVMSITEGTY